MNAAIRKIMRQRPFAYSEADHKTGVSMPQFFERDGRFFVCYNINKEHILLDEIPAAVLDKMTPGIG